MIYIGKFDSKEVVEVWIRNRSSEFISYNLTEKDRKYHLEVELNSDYDDIDEDYQKISCWNCYHCFEVLGDFICEVDHDYIKHDRSEGCEYFLRDV